MSLPRVLLVEDDPSLQRFVEMALDGLPIELRCCATLGDATALLREQRFALIITDLLLPDGSGRELLALLQREPALRGTAHCAVFSAGLDDAAKRADLTRLGAWRLLGKPCSLDELEALVNDALAAGAATPTPSPANDQVQRHFGGNEALYLAFRASCLQQFGQDRLLGDAACRDGDAPALQRLAHSLKSVLLSLGHGGESMAAAALEQSAAKADWAHAVPQWQALREQLAALR